MNKVYALIFVLFLSGCSIQLDKWKINAANNACKNHSGIDYIHVEYNIVRSTVYCDDGYQELIMFKKKKQIDV